MMPKLSFEAIRKVESPLGVFEVKPIQYPATDEEMADIQARIAERVADLQRRISEKAKVSICDQAFVDVVVKALAQLETIEDMKHRRWCTARAFAAITNAMESLSKFDLREAEGDHERAVVNALGLGVALGSLRSSWTLGEDAAVGVARRKQQRASSASGVTKKQANAEMRRSEYVQGYRNARHKNPTATDAIVQKQAIDYCFAQDAERRARGESELYIHNNEPRKSDYFKGLEKKARENVEL